MKRLQRFDLLSANFDHTMIMGARLPKPNSTKTEGAALLQKDDTITDLPGDKGRATVLINTDDYKIL